MDAPWDRIAASDKLLPWSRIEKIFVCVASILFLALCIGSMRAQSVTNNEMLFIPAGLSYIQRHDARMDIEEPPLIKLVAALPALLAGAKVDYNDASWNANPGAGEAEYLFGQKFFEIWNRDHRSMLFAARLPMIGLALLLGLSLYKMARRLAGPWGAALAVVLFVTSPFFISYGSLVHMDVPIALFSLYAMWSFATLWQEPTMFNAVLFSATLAGALVTKFSGVFLIPAIALAWAWFCYLERRSTNQNGSAVLVKKDFRRERLTISATIAAAVIVYLFYFGTFYRSDPRLILQNESDSIVKTGLSVLPIDILVRRMINHPALKPFLLAPSLYAGGLAYVLGHERRPVYFLGHLRHQGVWFYFPVISFFKLAPGMILVFVLVAIIAAICLPRMRRAKSVIVANPNRLHVRSIVAGLIVFAAIAMSSKLNVGVRHFSVPITFSVLLSSLIVPLTRSFFASKRRVFIFSAMAGLALSCLVTALLTYPHYLSYFNFFRLNMPKQEIAQNSNLNWGQSMEEVVAFFRERGVSAPYLDTGSTPIDPRAYIEGAHLWNCEKPDPVAEWVAISAYNLSHLTPACLGLQRYPSWSIGDGAVMVFHITDRALLDSTKR
jgi:hypothetical protein